MTESALGLVQDEAWAHGFRRSGRAIIDHWYRLALSYSPDASRDGLDALFELDAALGSVLRTTREPMVGQMRLAWWRDALQRLDTAPPPGEPVLQKLAAAVLPRGVTGRALSEMVDGWELLLGDLALPAIGDHGRLRGRVLFETAALLLAAAPGDPVSAAGEGWALADLADNLSDSALAAAARDQAAAALRSIAGTRWSRNARALGALALVARTRLGGAVPARFVFRLARLRLTGR